MPVVIEIIIGVSALIGILVLYGNKISNNAGSRAEEMLQTIESHYQTYIEKQKTLLLLENNDEKNKNALDATAINHAVEDVFCILKPDLDALIGQIKSTNSSDVKLKTGSRYFKNIASIAEALFEKRHKMGMESITEKDEEKIYAAAKDAILADLKERNLNWKIENL